jgi:hypothetical protein
VWATLRFHTHASLEAARSEAGWRHIEAERNPDRPHLGQLGVLADLLAVPLTDLIIEAGAAPPPGHPTARRRRVRSPATRWCDASVPRCWPPGGR